MGSAPGMTIVFGKNAPTPNCQNRGVSLVNESADERCKIGFGQFLPE